MLPNIKSVKNGPGSLRIILNPHSCSKNEIRIAKVEFLAELYLLAPSFILKSESF